MQVRYIAVSFVTLSLLLIAIFFTGHGSWLTKRRLALLLVIPVTTVAFALTTQYSTLFRYNYSLVETAGGFSVLGFTNGIWSSAVYLPFNYIMEVATFVLLLQVIFGGQKLYSRQALLFFIAILIPVIFDILFTLGISPVTGYNMVPSTFAFTGILLAIALFEFRFIDIVPTARTMLFEQMTDPMLVLDPEGRLVDFNPAAENVLAFNRVTDIGKVSSVLLKNHEVVLECIGQQHPAPCTITTGTGVEARLFEVSIQEMRSGGGMPPAKLVIMRDVTDRTRAEERAVHLASFPELTPVLTLEADPDGSIVYANPSCMSSLQEMGETDPRIFIPLDLRDRLDGTVIAESLHEVREIELHGRLFRENVYFTPQFSSIRIYATDITDRKRAEQELAAAQQQYGELFGNVSIGILRSTSGPQGAIIEANPAALRIFEADSREQLLAVLPSDLYFDRDERRRISEEIVATGAIDSMEVRYKTLKGRAFWGSITAKKKVSDDGQVYFDNTIEDISDRKLVEEALKESEEKFHAMFERHDSVMLLIEPETGNIIDANLAAERFYGRSQKELSSLSIDEINNLSPEETAAERMKAAREQKNFFTFRHRLASGAIRTVEVHSSPIHVAGKTVLFSIINDITDRILAEKALLATREWLGIALRAAHAGTWDWDIPTGKLTWSPEFFELFGLLPGAESSFETWRAALHPDDREQAEAKIDKSVKEHTSLWNEYRIILPEGQVRWIGAGGSTSYASGGEPLRMSGVCIDITDRKRAEEALHESESRFRAVIDSTPFPVAVADPEDTTVEFWSQSAVNLFGHTPATTAEWYQLAYPDPEYRNYVIEQWKPALERARLSRLAVNTGEYRVTCSDGSVRICELYAAFIAGKLIVTFNDITERKRAEETLRESEEKFATAFKTSPYAITITRASDGGFIDVNDGFTQITGYTHEETVTNSSIGLDLWVNMEDRKRVLSDLIGGRNVVGRDFLFRKKDGVIMSGLFSARIILLNKEPCILSSISDITDRKRAEEELRESELRFRTMADWTYDWEYWIDHQRNVVYMSPSVERITGYPAKDFIADRDLIDRIVHPDDRAAWDFHALLYTKVEVTDDPVEIEFRILTREGEIRWINHICRTICSDTATCIGRRVSNRDITDRKRAEEKLRETNDYLNSLFDYANAPIITWDPAFRITRFNHAFEHLSGRSQEEVIGKNLAILFPLESKEASLSLINKTLEGERWETVEIPILNADGSTRSVLWNSANVIGRDGNVIATIAQGVDITDQNQALDRIRWLASFPELNPNPVIEMDENGTITFANAVTSTTLYDLGLPDDPALFIPRDREEILRLLRETDELQLYREIVLGNEIFAENISLNRALQVARIYTTNITEVKRAEHERERMFADLEQKNAELERFAYTASHDLKTPLITIRGFLGFVERDAEMGDMVRMRQDILRISNATVRMQELLDSLLELSRIGRIVGPPEPVSMRELSGVAAELLAVPIQERGVTLRIAPDLPEVYGDKKRLLEVMTNLLENAVKFMGDQPAPQIEIGARYDGEKPVFFVRDNGIGIPHEYQSRLFTLFERIEINVPGTGVGLALVKRIIEIHGGKIWVESEGSGKGATFWFTLPGVPEIEDSNEVAEK